MTSFFGGNPSMSHFYVGVKRKVTGFKTGEERRQEGVRVREQQEKLKAAGHKTERYFQFRDKDEKGKAEAKKQAEAWAAKIEKELGVEMYVTEGFFL